MYKRTFFLLAFALATLPGFAQYGYEAQPSQAKTGKLAIAAPADSSFSRTEAAPQRMHFGLQVGTGLSTNFRGGSSFNTFVSPYLSYRLSPRWTVNAGATIVNGSFGAFYPTGDFRQAMAPTQQTYLFAQGQYQASERLWIMGTTYYQTSRMNGAGPNSMMYNTPQNYQYNSQGMSVYAQYKISEHFSVGAGVQYSNGNPYNGFNGMNGFGGPGFGGPTFGGPGFGGSSFGRPAFGSPYRTPGVW